MQVTIVIPNYNGKHFMKPCLESLDRQTCKDFEIIVVDNASSDGSIEYMEDGNFVFGVQFHPEMMHAHHDFALDIFKKLVSKAKK